MSDERAIVPDATCPRCGWYLEGADGGYAPAPKTYKDGLDEGKAIGRREAFEAMKKPMGEEFQRGLREMAEAACKAICDDCAEGDLPFSKSDLSYWHSGKTHEGTDTEWRCEASEIRRAAKERGVELDAPSAQEGK